MEKIVKIKISQLKNDKVLSEVEAVAANRITGGNAQQKFIDGLPRKDNGTIDTVAYFEILDRQFFEYDYSSNINQLLSGERLVRF